MKAAAESAMREVVGRSEHPAAPHPGPPDHRDRRPGAHPGRRSTTTAPASQITQVQLLKVDPPAEVIASFRDVQAARADQERAPERGADLRQPGHPGSARPGLADHRGGERLSRPDHRRGAGPGRPLHQGLRELQGRAGRDPPAHVPRDDGGGVRRHGQDDHRREAPAAPGVVPYLPLDQLNREPQRRHRGRRANEARHLRRRRPRHPRGDRASSLYLSVFIVDQTQQALVLRFGQVGARGRPTPGLYYKLPLIDNVVYFDKRILDLDSPPLEIIASDQKRLVVDAFGRYKIINPLLFFQSVGTIAVADQRLSVAAQLGGPPGARRRDLHPARPRRARRADGADHRAGRPRGARASASRWST